MPTKPKGNSPAKASGKGKAAPATAGSHKKERTTRSLATPAPTAPPAPAKPAKARKTAAAPVPAPTAAPAPAPAPAKVNTGVEFVPTDADRQVVILCMAAGFTQEQTARQVRFPVGISVETLTKYFQLELETGADRVAADIVRNLSTIARTDRTKTGVTAGIFWLKARRGWRDNDGIGVKAEVKVPAGTGAAVLGDVPKSAIEDDGTITFTLKIGDASPRE